MSDNTGPYKGDGETVYATAPVEEKTPEKKEIEGPKYRDKEWLFYQYKVLKKSMSEIAEDVGCHDSTISYWLDKHGMEIRTLSEARHVKDTPKELLDESFVKTEYIEKKKSATEMSESIGCSPRAVYNALDRFGIDRRNVSEATLAKYDGKHRDHDWLFDQIVIKNRPLEDIAKDCSVAPSTIHAEQMRAGIPPNSKCATRLRTEIGKNSVPRVEGETRNLVGGDLSIDASWRYFNERNIRGRWVPYKDGEWLREKYSEDGLSSREISKECSDMGCDVSPSTILNHLRTFNIDVRSEHPTGESHPQSKMDASDVVELREDYLNLNMSHNDLSDEYGISASTVRRIVNGELWQDAPGPIKGEDY